MYSSILFILREVFPTYSSWQYVRISAKLEIGYLVVSIFNVIMEDTTWYFAEQERQVVDNGVKRVSAQLVDNGVKRVSAQVVDNGVKRTHITETQGIYYTAPYGQNKLEIYQ
jgi:hypothetical protein